MKKIFTLIGFSLLVSLNSIAVNYTSAGVGPADWNNSASWLPAGIPGVSDNVVIAVGHTITVANSRLSNNLTVNGTLKFLANVGITVVGDYVLAGTGSEVGIGQLGFNGPGTNLNVLGTTSSTLRYYFNSNRTISASSVITKTGSTTQFAVGRVVTNLGTFTIGSVLTTATSKWINGSGSTLTLTINGFMAGALFDATASNNTVIISYIGGSVPQTLSAAGYSNLTVGGTSGTKTLLEDLIVSKNLTINGGNTLSASGFNITVKGNWVKNGSFTASSGKTVTFNGTTAQTISGVSTTTFEQLTINNTSGVSITSGSYNLNEVLTISNGTFATGGNTFKMVSTTSKTARIAPVTGTGSISGNFTVERFIDARPDTTWANLSSPVQSSTFGDWANELPAISYSFSPPNAYPTQYTYSEPLDNYVAVTSAGTALTVGKGFEVFLSGGFTYTPIGNTTLNTIGVPNFGNQNLNSLVSFTGATSHSNLVGNPFASSIAWNSVLAASSNINNTYDIFDHLAQTYSTFGAGTEIGAGQGFWVYTNASSPTLIINENAKTTASNSSIKSTIINEPYFVLKFSNNVNHYAHSLKIATNDNATNNWDENKDHLFHKSPNKSAPSIYTTISGKKAVINYFNSSDENNSIEITTEAGLSGYYTINASGLDNLSSYACITLEDKLLNKFIDLSKDNSYSFFVNTSDNKNRFVLHLSKSGNCKSPANNNQSLVNDNSIQILPSLDGNSIFFNYKESTVVSISVCNLLGQYITEKISSTVSNQTLNVYLPSEYRGMYLLRVETEKEIITQKFVKQ